jgi:alpha-glucosidase
VALAALLLSLCAFSFEAQAAWRTAGDVTALARQANGATFTLSSGARVSVTFVTPGVVRVRFAPTGVFERDESYAVVQETRVPVVAVVGEARRGSVGITTPGGASVVVNRRPFLLTIQDSAGRTLVADDPKRPVMFDLESGAIEASKRRDYLEFYYGFGEKALPSARQGRTMTMWNTDTYAYAPGLDPIYQSIPFFIALRQGRAYGLFLDNTSRTFFDMGNTAPERYTFGAQGGELDYYVFTGGSEQTPASVVRDYTALTGRMPLPPLWSLGFQQSRYSYFPEARVREVARGLRERRIPADVIYLDIDYMDGYRVFTWDRERFPDPPRMLRELRAEGFRTVVIIDPGIKVDENYHAYREGRAGGFFVKTSEGAELRERVWPGVCAFPDFTDPKARAWFGSLYRSHLDEGISGFWNDMNEPGTFGAEQAPPQPRVTHDPTKTFPLTARHAGDGRPGTHARYHNVYGMQMARSTFEGLQKLRPQERPFVLTRAGYAGIQRYSAVWTGDNVASWEHLQLSIAMLTGLGVSGVPFVGADVGGFSGDSTPELYARWLQAAALTPFFRSHVEKGRQDREPWSFGADVERISRATIELRYQLLPFLYTLFREHEETGAPPMRPLWFNYPDDYATYNPTLSTEQFMLGRDLLVAPVLIPGEVRRVVYFPRGDAWLDWWTGARYEGGTHATVDAPLERLPLFVRVGAAIPTQPVVQHTGEMARAPLSLVVALDAQPSVETNVAPAETARTPSAQRNVSRLYEDAGEGFDYRRGAFRTLAVTLDGNSIRLARTGAYNVSRPLSTIELRGLATAPRELRIGNRRIENFSFDAAARRVSLPLPAEKVEEITVVP